MAQSLGELVRAFGPTAQLTQTLGRARTYAHAQSHRMVTLEHLLLALTEDPDAALVLKACNVDLTVLKTEVSHHLGHDADRIEIGEDGYEPPPNADLVRIFELAHAAARQRDRAPSGGLVLAAIVGDARSPSANMLRVQGLTFEGAIQALQNANAQLREPTQPATTDPQQQAGPANEGQPASTSAATVGAAPPPPARPVEAGRPRVSLAVPDPIDSASAASVTQNRSTTAPGAGSAARPPSNMREILDDARRRVDANRPIARALRSNDQPTRPSSPPARAGLPQPPVPGPSVRPPAPVRPDPHPGRGEAGTGTGTLPATGPRTPSDLNRPVAHPAPPSIATHRGQVRPDPHGQQPAPVPTVRPPASPAEPNTRSQVQAPSRTQPHAPWNDQGDARLPPQARQPVWPSQPAQSATDPQRAGHLPHVHGRSNDAFSPDFAPRPIPIENTSGRPPSAGYGPAEAAPRMLRAPEMPDDAVPPTQPPQHPQSRGRPLGKTTVGQAKAGQSRLGKGVARRLRVGDPEVVEVRIARQEIEAINAGTQARSTQGRRDFVVSKAMTMRLRAPQGGFTIESGSPETQWIENRVGLVTDEFVIWRWTVTPKLKGARSLQLVANYRTVMSDGLATETPLPEEVIEVRVRTRRTHLLRNGLVLVTGFAAGAGFGYFGNDILAIVRSMI